MEWKSIKNNIFLYFLSLSNAINYIFYFPIIILYLVESDSLKNIDFIKLYIFFIIYDLVRNIFFFIIRKIIYCVGLNKKITFDLIIITLISVNLFYILFNIYDKSFYLNILFITRIIYSITNISSVFISKIANSLFERKEFLNKLNNFDFYEKLNNFIIFLFIFFFINSLDKFYLYFFASGIFNLFFCILYIFMFKCYDEKSSLLYEEQDIKISRIINNRKNVKLKNINRIQNVKGTYTIGEENSLSKSNKKDIFDKKHRKTPSEAIVNIKLNQKTYSTKSVDIDNNDNNDNILSTNNNQACTNKESTNLDIIKNNDNLESNTRYQNKELYIINNIPISSSNRQLNEKIRKNASLIDTKNVKTINRKKWAFIFLILIPSKFLKYLFLIMLFLKTYSLKDVFKIKIHLIFYLCYFFMNILIYPLNKKVFSKIIKTNSGKRKMHISSIIFSIPACLGYIYLILDNPLNSSKMQLEKYILFFILNFILKECLYILLRIYYLNSISIGFSETIFRNMKEISNILTCILFIGYNILLLYIKNDSITHKIIRYVCYYLFPIAFLLIFYINTIYISKH